MHSICFVGSPESRIVAEIVMNGLRQQTAWMEKTLPLPQWEQQTDLFTTAATFATVSVPVPALASSIVSTEAAIGTMLPSDSDHLIRIDTAPAVQKLQPLMKEPTRFDVAVIVDGSYLTGKLDNAPTEATIVLPRVKDNGFVVASHEWLYRNQIGLELFNVVTYGLDQNATVTVSSIDDKDQLSMTLCLQAAVPSLGGTLIQPFETQVRTDGEYNDVNLYLAAMASMLVLGIKF